MVWGQNKLISGEKKLLGQDIKEFYYFLPFISISCTSVYA